MLYVGIDAGSRATKLVAVDGSGAVVRRAVADQSIQPAVTARALFDGAVGAEEVGRCVATGYARNLLAFADRAVTEITCHAKGCAWLYPDAGAVVEIGGQDSKFIRLAQGRVHDFVMNDRCAAGTGRFLEVVAVRLGVSLGDLQDLLREAQDAPPVTVSSMCVVFAETEIIGLLAAGAPPAVILRGVQRAVATRVVAMMGGRRQVQGDTVFTGGVAQVHGMREALEDALGRGLRVPEMPQYTGALGAALIARQDFLTTNC